MLRILFAGSLFSLLLSCSSNKDPFAGLLRPEALPAEAYRIDNDRDTVLRTAKGALLRIGKGSFSGDVTLLVREAYTISDIVKGGLLTESSGAALTSGGMIEVRAQAGEGTLVKPIGISIPTRLYDPAMKIYAGAAEDGVIEWKDPEPLGPDTSVVQGRQLFQQICATCHDLNKELAGPALRGFRERGPWSDQRELYKFMDNPAAYIACNPYAKELQLKYGSIMQSFPSLTPAQIDAITAYIESDAAGNSLPDLDAANCFDSCMAYEEASAKVKELQRRQDALIAENGPRVETDYHRDSGGLRPAAPIPQGDAGTDDKVRPETFGARYYNFKIDAFGWYNVDYPVGTDGVADRFLSVAIDQRRTSAYNVFLAVPAYRIFTEGGRLSGKSDAYGFFRKDGTIPLPLKTKAVVFAISEQEGRILFGSTVFAVKDRNELRLNMVPMDKAGFDRAMAALQLDDLKTGVKDAKNAAEVLELEGSIRSEQQESDKLRPKNCDCGCDKTVQL